MLRVPLAQQQSQCEKSSNPQECGRGAPNDEALNRYGERRVERQAGKRRHRYLGSLLLALLIGSSLPTAISEKSYAPSIADELEDC